MGVPVVSCFSAFGGLIARAVARSLMRIVRAIAGSTACWLVCFAREFALVITRSIGRFSSACRPPAQRLSRQRA